MSHWSTKPREKLPLSGSQARGVTVTLLCLDMDALMFSGGQGRCGFVLLPARHLAAPQLFLCLFQGWGFCCWQLFLSCLKWDTSGVSREAAHWPSACHELVLEFSFPAPQILCFLHGLSMTLRVHLSIEAGVDAHS